jgi:hypothetical protein
LQRLRAALEIVDLDLKAFPGEIAAALRDGQRRIGDQRLAADRELDRGLFRLGRPSLRG